MMAKFVFISIFGLNIIVHAAENSIYLQHAQCQSDRQQLTVPVVIDAPNDAVKSIRLGLKYNRGLVEFDALSSQALPIGWTIKIIPLPNPTPDSGAVWIVLRGGSTATLQGRSVAVANMIFVSASATLKNTAEAVTLSPECEKTNWVVKRQETRTDPEHLVQICGADLDIDGDGFNLDIAPPLFSSHEAAFPIIIDSRLPIKQLKLTLDYDHTSLYTGQTQPVVTLNPALREMGFQIGVNAAPSVSPASWARQNLELELANAMQRTFTGTSLEIAQVKFVVRDTLQAPRVALNSDCAAGYVEYLTAAGTMQRQCWNGQIPTSVQVEQDENANLPRAFNLSPSYPNPIITSGGGHAHATMRYTLPQPELVSIKVYDVLGRTINTLVSQSLPPGSYQAVWRGDSEHGELAHTGIYFVRMQAGNFTKTIRLLLLH